MEQIVNWLFLAKLIDNILYNKQNRKNLVRIIVIIIIVIKFEFTEIESHNVK